MRANSNYTSFHSKSRLKCLR